MGSNPLPDTFFSIKSKDFYKEKFIEMINLKPKEQIKPRKFKKRIFLIGHSYTTVHCSFWVVTASFFIQMNQTWSQMKAGIFINQKSH